VLKKLLKRILLVFVIGAAILVVFLGYLINLMINRPQFLEPRPLEDKDYQEFWAVNENGHKIFACYFKNQPGQGTVLLCHGHGVSHGLMNDMVAFLRKTGVGLILIDFRAHGRSEGKLCTIGLNEWKDLQAVLAEATRLGYITNETPIAGFGRSMGAATLIHSAEHLPQIKAFILESSFERLRLIAARDAKHNINLPDTPLTDLAFWLIDRITSTPYSQNNPVEKIANIGNRPALLIHDELDHRANESAFKALHAALPNAKTFIAKDARHVQAHKIQPEEFEKTVLQFLTEAGIISQP